VSGNYTYLVWQTQQCPPVIDKCNQAAHQTFGSLVIGAPQFFLFMDMQISTPNPGELQSDSLEGFHIG
jgi:hypothetical protein